MDERFAPFPATDLKPFIAAMDEFVRDLALIEMQRKINVTLDKIEALR